MPTLGGCSRRISLLWVPYSASLIVDGTGKFSWPRLRDLPASSTPRVSVVVVWVSSTTAVSSTSVRAAGRSSAGPRACRLRNMRGPWMRTSMYDWQCPHPCGWNPRNLLNEHDQLPLHIGVYCPRLKLKTLPWSACCVVYAFHCWASQRPFSLYCVSVALVSRH